MEGTVTISLKDFKTIEHKAKLLDENVNIVHDILKIHLPSGGSIKDLDKVKEIINKKS
jgi:hypothetical protein